MAKKLLLVLACVVMTSSASALDVPDGDFEQAIITINGGLWDDVDDYWGNGLYAKGETPWQGTRYGEDAWMGHNYSSGGLYPGTGHSGAQWVDMNSSYIHQLLTDTYVENTTYIISAWATTNANNQLLQFYFSTDTTDGLTGGTITNAGNHYPSNRIGTWVQYSGIYTATADDDGKQIGICIYGRSGTYIDDVTVDILVNKSPTDGLVGYWPMDEGSGSTVEDMTIGGSDGSIDGAGWTAGKFGTGLSFDGSSDFVDCGINSSLQPTTAITVSAWVRPDGFAYYGGIAGPISDSSSARSGYVLMTNDNSRFGAGVCGGNHNVDYLNVGTYPDRQWYHVLFTNDSFTTRLYVNGVQVGNDTVFTPIDYNPVSFFEIGRFNDDFGTHFFDGIIDEVAVWDRSLWPSEVAELYESGPIGRVLSVEVTETDGGTEVTEGDANDIYKIFLHGAPTEDVYITATPGDGQIDIGEGPGVAKVLTFTSSDWYIEQEITVIAYDDDVYEGYNEPNTIVITHTCQSVDSEYDGMSVDSVSVTVHDDERICGNWGYLPSDTNKDCYVDMLDLIEIINRWMQEPQLLG